MRDTGRIFVYWQVRILTFIDPSTDPLGAGYNTTQASIAIGSGGVVGKGWLNGTQAHLDLLPEKHTDFIFAVFGEEFGLILCVVVMALYMTVVMGGTPLGAPLIGLIGERLGARWTLIIGGAMVLVGVGLAVFAVVLVVGLVMAVVMVSFTVCRPSRSAAATPTGSRRCHAWPPAPSCWPRWSGTCAAPPIR